MKRLNRHKSLVFLTCLSFLIAGSAQSAPSAPSASLRVKNRTLIDVHGKKVPLVDAAAVTVLVFYQPDQSYSKIALKELQGCDEKSAGHLRFVGVVPHRYSVKAIERAMKKDSVVMPVLRDKQGRLGWELGVKVHPWIGIVSTSGQLLAKQTWTSADICRVVKTTVRRALGRATKQQLREAIDPKAVVSRTRAGNARRHTRLARMLLKSKRYAKAEAEIRRALSNDDRLAEAHAVLGAILAARGNCRRALAAFARALKLDAKQPLAIKGKRSCRGK